MGAKYSDEQCKLDFMTTTSNGVKFAGQMFVRYVTRIPSVYFLFWLREKFKQTFYFYSFSETKLMFLRDLLFLRKCCIINKYRVALTVLCSSCTHVSIIV